MALVGRNILVTGGAGFFGSHLVKSLLDEKLNVVVADIAGRNSRSYFFQQKLFERVIYEPWDITDFKRVHSVIINNQINFVFHIAAQAIVENAYHNPLEAINSNVIGTANVLESCRLYGKVDGVLVTSTDKAYGKLPRVDEDKPLSGDHPYEVSKASADLIARSYFRTYKLPVVVTRFGNVYGEGDLNFSRIIPGIMAALCQTKTLDIRSNGKFVRDYVYVKDVVDATLLLANNIKRIEGQAFNISSLENLSVIELVKKIEKIIGEKINYKILSKAINEIPKQSVNFNKIKKTLGWKPQNNLKTTIPSIYEWYKLYFGVK